MMDFIDRIIALESGELNEDETIELFQGMVDDGSVWSLQGSYGRTAQSLIDAGLIEVKNNENSKTV